MWQSSTTAQQTKESKQKIEEEGICKGLTLKELVLHLVNSMSIMNKRMQVKHLNVHICSTLIVQAKRLKFTYFVH